MLKTNDNYFIQDKNNGNENAYKNVIVDPKKKFWKKEEVIEEPK